MAPRFVICSDPRTGGHMLATALAGHPQLRVAGEIFVRPELFGLPPRPARVRLDPAFPQRVIAAAWERFDGFIIHRRFHRGLEAIGGDRDVRVLFIRRDDWLAQFASEQLALRTGVWHIARAGRDYLSNDGGDQRVADLPRLQLSRDACCQYRRAAATRERRALHLLRQNRRLDVAYERLTTDWATAIGEVQDFLSLPRQPLAPTTERQEQRPLEAVVENLAELREYFDMQG